MNFDYLQKFCAHFDYPQACREQLEAAFRAVEAVPEVCKAWEDFLEGYRKNGAETDFTDQPGKMMENLPPVKAENYTLAMLFYLLCAEHMHELYRERGLSDELFYNAALDLWAKAVECKKVYGYYGNFTGNWPQRFYKIDRFALGRLQFELEKDWTFTTPDGKYAFNHVAKISVHIPSHGPLHKEELDEAFRMAAEFYKDFFPDGYVMFSCNSWLLSPYHREVLKPTSGIVTFMDEFDWIVDSKWGAESAVWRIFDTKECDDLDALPQNTTLQRAYIPLLRKNATEIPTGIGFKFMRL